ncbi:uncharacterized protein TRIADDRAFT_54182 [Trichoplax adhaerens]|uniref:CMP/dCMP-type deaminase domain-containing protein n=1 Tax=Trichoplax adhaerens TaxID=10228 RepID=B3RRC1_TRIAD|nr:hypothetical protein TRIADDRAFT_54182 [Trichoplax adhaerens]EDV26852.1 hypothetical protein TRIADDRAFT_54182 [Trichoplax adhaerens]|eukprot:XP_002110848.1 hypothetical protein TRIADDRAFT_54182 [Trichoplax adhaerens]
MLNETIISICMLAIRQFKDHLPLDGLTHVKRIRKDEHGNYAIIVCLRKHLSDISELAMQEWIKNQPISWEYLGNLYIVQVAATSALTRKQFEVASKYWPISFYEDKRISTAIEGKLFNQEVIQNIYNNMDIAISTALENSMFKIGAVMVDPESNKVLAKASDGRSRNVDSSLLKHAVMTCIDDIGKMHVAVENTNNSSKLPNEESNNQRGYLCTGYDLYVTKEPCVMCAMALVHSRIKRVFYAVEDKEYGALGSRYKIHVHEGLNHHFEVFKNIYRDRCLQLQ